MSGGSGRITDTELLRAVLAGAPVRVGALDRDGRFLLDPDPNPPAPSDAGAPPGASFFELYGDRPGALEAVRTAFAGEEVHVTREQGGATYMATFLPRRGPSGDVDAILAVATVLAKESVVHQALAEVQARERRIFNSPMIGLLYWTESGAITDANDAFLQLVGYTRNDLALGRLDWRAMTPIEHRAADDVAMAELHTSGACTPFEKEYIHKDGSRVAVLVGASTDGGQRSGVAFVVDVSDRKRSERERREAAATLQRVVDAAPLVLWSVDTAGIFTLSMGRALRGLGVEPGQVVGQSVFDLYASVPDILAAIRRGLAGEEFSETAAVGDLVFETLFSPLRDVSGKVTGLLGVSIDLTERKRAESAHEQLRAQLLRVQKLESLGLLAGGIAHDFNNVLTVILGGASTALLNLPPENPARDDIENVITAAQGAARLTRQMLAYSGKAHIEIRPMDLSLLVREITSLLETTVPKKVQLRLELPARLPAIDADVAQVQQIVMNLVINGAEAIGDQPGTVLVTTGRQTVDEVHASSLFAAEQLSPGEYVFLEVRDTGRGMDEATKSKVFDPFFTTKFTGRGLGLAAVLGIVRAHRGAISVCSNPGRGTTFKVFFPASFRGPRPEQRFSAPDYRGKGLVLVVDDDPGVRGATRRMLELFGFSVIEARDGREGADMFASRAGEIVLVLVDMTMPNMNGEEAFTAIRRVRADAPVILMSGYDEIEATRRFVSKGLAGFLEKPFTAANLAAKLAKVLGPAVE